MSPSTSRRCGCGPRGWANEVHMLPAC
jgi:hypothetical protein